MRAPTCAGAARSRALLNPIPDWACAEGRLRHAVLCEAREEPFERPLPDLVVDRCSTLFLQDCVAVNTREPFLFNKGQVPTFPRCCCRVLWEEPRRSLAHRLPLFDRPKAVLLVDVDSGQRPPE